MHPASHSAICFDRYSVEYARYVFGIPKNVAKFLVTVGRVGHTYISTRLVSQNALSPNKKDFSPTVSCHGELLDCYEDGTCTQDFVDLGCEAVLKYARELRAAKTCVIDFITSQWNAFASQFEPRVLKIAIKLQNEDPVFIPEMNTIFLDDAAQNILEYASKHASIFLHKSLGSDRSALMAYLFDAIPNWHKGMGGDASDMPDETLVFILDFLALRCAERIKAIRAKDHLTRDLVAMVINQDCKDEAESLNRNFLINIVMSDPAAFLKCFDSNKKANAIRCLPTMESSVGFYGVLKADEKNASPDKFCGSHEYNSEVKVHPAFIRKSVESLMLAYQGRRLDIATAAPSYAWMHVSRRFTSSVPSQCFDHNSDAMCWMFSRCAKMQAKALNAKL